MQVSSGSLENDGLEEVPAGSGAPRDISSDDKRRFSAMDRSIL